MSEELMSCKHMSFDAQVCVMRLEDSGQFHADVRIKCSECNLPFEFQGLPLGMNLQGAAMSVDAQEARLAIIPAGTKPAPLDGLCGYLVGKNREH